MTKPLYLTKAVITAGVLDRIVDIDDDPSRDMGKTRIIDPVTGSPVVPSRDTISIAAHGVTNVESAGARVQLPSNECAVVVITAKKTNLGKIYVGGSAVTPENAGFELDAGESVPIPVNNTDKIWIDADNDGEGIRWIAYS